MMLRKNYNNPTGKKTNGLDEVIVGDLEPIIETIAPGVFGFKISTEKLVERFGELDNKDVKVILNNEHKTLIYVEGYYVYEGAIQESEDYIKNLKLVIE